jgi:hypothetical protein
MAANQPQNGILWPIAGDGAAPKLNPDDGFGCPPEYLNLTHRQINTKMMARSNGRRKPCYQDATRGWLVLGYTGAAKPAWEVFRGQMNNLWAFVNHRYSRHREMRAAILDALRALGVRNPRWNVTYMVRTAHGQRNIDALFSNNSKKIDPMAEVGYPIRGGPINRDGFNGGWAAVPDPPAAMPRGGAVQTDYELMNQYCVDAGHARTGRELKEVQLRNVEVWQRYHRYQGFWAYAQDDPEGPSRIVNFRAIAMPQGPESLWHAIS